jgi:hypothetical protein
MNVDPEWLPPLVLLHDSGGSWDRYVEVLYAHFREDFVDRRACFRGIELRLKRYPLTDGKEATFWHLISKGRDEQKRIPDIERCERIRWPRPVIEHCEETVIRMWPTIRRGERRICLWLVNQDYLVVLASRNGYLMPWTAYVVRWEHTRKRLQREFEEHQKLKPPA